MKKFICITAMLFIVILLSSCFNTNSYSKYEEFDLIAISAINDEFELHMKGEKYLTVNDVKWHPDEIYYDEICGRCDYNGVTLIYPTSSPICFFVKNTYGINKPAVRVYEKGSEGVWDLLTKNPNVDTVDEIFFENMNPKNDTIDAKDIINDAELIRKIFDLINNQDEYIEIEADKVLDLAGNWNGGYIYGDITKEDGCLVNIAGYMRCYNNTLVGLHSYITIIEHEQNFYYVISEKDGIYTCVKDKNTIGSAITQQLNNVDNYN